MGKSVHIRNRNGRLYIETYIFGKQSRKSLGLRLTGNKKQDKKVFMLAEIIRSRREMQLACAEWGIPDCLSSDKALHVYMEENMRKSGNVTLKNCLSYLKRYRYGEIRLSQITPKWLEDFQEWLRSDTGLSQGSASLYSSALRHQLRLAVRDGVLTLNPADFVKNIKMPESRKQPLSLQSLKRLASIPINGALGSEVKRAFLFSCFTGLRISDLRSLERNMIVTRSDGIMWICKEQKKTKTMVNIPLNVTALSILGQETAADGERLVFPLLARSKANTDQYLSKWGKMAGVEHVSWHTARHTMATIALENGAELRTVSELLGHIDISTTLRYAKATDSLKVSAVGSMPGIEIEVENPAESK